MPVYGDLATMPLTDVLQWIGVSQKTGVLEVERGGLRRRIEFNKGFVGACHANDRGSSWGSTLVARGLITEAQLDRAVVQQALGGNRLGWILVEQGALTDQDARRMINAHIEQTIQRLVEWDDAVFRFYEGATFDPVRIEVSVAVNDLLLRTAQHQDELKRIRQAFSSSGSVLRPTDMPVPEDLAESEMSRKIFESIDGRRTIGEVVIEARASEILVLKLLYRLFTMGLVEVAETRSAVDGIATLLDPLAKLEETHGTNAELERLGSGPETNEATRLAEELALARRLADRGEYAVAIELLHATSRASPDEAGIGALQAEVEARRSGDDAGSPLPLSHIPVRTADPDSETLDSEESFLLSLIDGSSDVRSIVSLAALREAEVLGTLELMVEKGWISLSEPVPSSPGSR